MTSEAGARNRVGVAIQTGDAAAALGLIVEAERLGIPAAWMTTGGVQADALTLFGAAAARTERILLGTAIIPTWPRNPVFIAQQVEAIEAIAPGRLRLGIGPSTEAAMRPFGVEFRTPLRQLREYLTVLRALLQEGSVDFDGKLVRARARIAKPTGTPVMASALQENAFVLCGRLADGAISWVCPWSYIERVAIPALRRGAAEAGREPPPLIMHIPVCVTEDPEVARASAQRQVGMYARFQFYSQMFKDAGHAEASEGLSQALVDDLVIYGSEAEVAEKLAARAAVGFGEVMAMPLIVGDDRDGSMQRTFAAIARAAGGSVVRGDVPRHATNPSPDPSQPTSLMERGARGGPLPNSSPHARWVGRGRGKGLYPMEMRGQLLRTVAWASLRQPGIEHVALWRRPHGYRVHGFWIGADDGQPARAAYWIELDPAWHVLRVVAAWSTPTATRRMRLRRDSSGTWQDGGGVRADLAGCVDLDIAWTPLTNTLPIRRLGLAVGERRALAVAYISLPHLTVSPDAQRYTRLGATRWRYESMDSDFTAELIVDQDGLVIDYPPLFRRIAQWGGERE